MLSQLPRFNPLPGRCTSWMRTSRWREYGPWTQSWMNHWRRGVRTALGAQRGHVLGLVLKEGTKLIAIGIGVGLMFAFIASRAMISLLYGIKPTDIPTFLGVSFVLALLALVAC